MDPFTFHKIDTKSLPVSLETPSRGKCKEIRRQTVSTGVKKAQISMALWVRHRDFISTECWGEIIARIKNQSAADYVHMCVVTVGWRTL